MNIMGTVLDGAARNKYQALADDLELQIREGILTPGERLPSVRAMSNERGLSINTVVTAYELLERKGLLTSRPQSGFYVLGVQESGQLKAKKERATIPSNVKIPDLVGILLDSGKNQDFLQLGAAYLSPSLYPLEKLNQLTRQVLRDSPEAAAVYEMSPGNADYLKQVTKLLARRGCRVAPNEVLATNGATEAVSLALRATCGSGATVVAESPLFFGILQAIEGLGLKVIEIPSHPSDGIDLDELRRVLKRHKVSAMVVMPNFNNPLGSAMPDSRKVELLSILERYGTPAIEDDVYGDLPFHGHPPKPLKAFDHSNSVITCSSFSKTVCPGLRAGWIAPGKYFKQIRRLQLSTTLAAGTVSQKVMAEYLSTRNYEKHLNYLRLLFSIQVNKTAQEVLSHFPEGTRVSSPQGGFVLWVEMPRGTDSVDLYRKALTRKITFSPGVLFSGSGNYRNFLRLNCAIEWSPKVEAGIQALGRLVKSS